MKKEFKSSIRQKSILSILLCFIMIFHFIPLNVFAEQTLHTTHINQSNYETYSKHSITISKTLYGSIETYPANSTVDADNTVIVYVVPYTGYAVLDVSVLSTDGTSIPITVDPLNYNRYTFTMPDCDVIISATFVIMPIQCADNNNDHKCDDCGKTLSECSDANNDHKCDICSKVLSECADTDNDHKCNICSKVLSECLDANNDHKCDICSKILSECSDDNNDHKCDICSKVLSECADTNNDHICDICSKVLSECLDTNNDHKCDICSKILSECADTDNDHICDICSKVLGECLDTDNDHICDICSKVLSECTDTDNNHKCDICSKILSECADTDNDHICDNCGKTLSEYVNVIKNPKTGDNNNLILWITMFLISGIGLIFVAITNRKIKE